MFDWLGDISPQLGVIYIILFASGVLAVQGVLGVVQLATNRQTINRRLQVKANAGTVENLITELRRERGLDADGNFSMVLVWFNKLVTKSGLRYEPVKWAILSAVVSAIICGTIVYFTKYMIALLAWPVLVVILPLQALRMVGTARAAKLAAQLPDALGIVVRSLEAGHPVPMAISLVGKEMPDPIGSEFGMLGDEMSYGSSLGDAIQRLSRRSEDGDIDLFAATVRLQERTGGNLAELLKLNAQAIRDRQMLRLKVKAATSEGRASAMILTAAPFIVMALIYFLRPEFYGAVWDKPLVKYGLGIFLVWMFIGNFIMQRMINFKI